MAVDFGLLPIMITLSVGAIIGGITRSLLLGMGASVTLLGWVAINTQQGWALGMWFLVLFIISLATARGLTTMVLGDVS